MKTIVASSHCTRTDFIELQYKSLKKFLKGEYEYVIFNDGEDEKSLNNFNNNNIRNDIRNKCFQLEIKCIDIPQHLHKNRKELFPNTDDNDNNHVSKRASIAVQYIYNYASTNNYDKLMIIEADMFIIEELNLNNYNDFDVGYLFQSRYSNKYEKLIEYMWIGILIIDFSNIKNLDPIYFDCGKILDTPVDSGGYSYFWLEKYKDKVKIKNFDKLQVNDINSYNNLENKISPSLKKYFEKIMNINSNIIRKELFFNNKILHLRGAGSNWDYTNEPFKKYLVNKFNDSILEKNIFLLDGNILANEWKNFQNNLSNILIEYINEITCN